MPLRYLFEPWTAPKAVQEKANCIIGVDYPSPMVEHQKASKHCYNLMMEVRDKLSKTNKGMAALCSHTVYQINSIIFMETCYQRMNCEMSSLSDNTETSGNTLTISCCLP